MTEGSQHYEKNLQTLIEIRDSVQEDATLLSPDSPAHAGILTHLETLNWAVSGMVELRDHINSGPGAYYDPRSHHYRQYNGD